MLLQTHAQAQHRAQHAILWTGASAKGKFFTVRHGRAFSQIPGTDMT